jgi:hypothetical protein
MVLTPPKTMKSLLLLTIHVAITLSSSGQQISISWPLHWASWPYENYYQFQVKNVPCSRIVVKADQGVISQFGCELTYHADSVGYAIFRFYQKSRIALRLIDTVLFVVRLNERVYLTLGATTAGQISKVEVLKIGGVLLREFVIADVEGSDWKRSSISVRPAEFTIR